MKFDGAGSITGAGLVLAPDTHTVRVDVANVGTTCRKRIPFSRPQRLS
jgi:hypothetical protein